MSNATHNQLIADIAHDVVAQMAPQELPFLSATTEAYFTNPRKMRQDQAGKDETLGFGAAEIAALSPIIITIVDDTLKFILEEVLPRTKEAGIICRIFARSPAPTKNKDISLPLALTSEQLQRVHDQAITNAMRFKQLSRAQADQMATLLVGRLALTNP